MTQMSADSLRNNTIYIILFFCLSTAVRLRSRLICSTLQWPQNSEKGKRRRCLASCASGSVRQVWAITPLPTSLVSGDKTSHEHVWHLRLWSDLFILAKATIIVYELNVLHSECSVVYGRPGEQGPRQEGRGLLACFDLPLGTCSEERCYY